MRLDRAGLWSAWFLMTVLRNAPAAYGHCSETPPQVEMSYPSAGVAVQKAYYPDYGKAFIDTFYREILYKELLAKYQAARHVAYGYVDKVHRYVSEDTIRHNGQIDYIQPYDTEDLQFSFPTDLKGVMPKPLLPLREKWVEIPGYPLAFSYIGLLDTPFVAFFNSYDSTIDLGLGPVDGCFYEPQGYFIYGDSIHRKGVPGERMPGVAVSVADFFTGIGQARIDPPPVRKSSGIIRKQPGLFPLPADPGFNGTFPYDLSGRRLRGFPGGDSRGFPKPGMSPMGWYWFAPGKVPR
jgi:hypothetical protein